MQTPSTPIASAPPLHRFRYRVRFQDIDAAGIVFFARFFEIFHDAYVETLRANGCDLVRVLDEKIWAAPLTRAHAEYRRPLRFGDEIMVEVAAEQNEKGVSMLFRAVSSADATVLFASGKTDHAFVDAQTFKRVAVPTEVLKALGL